MGTVRVRANEVERGLAIARPGRRKVLVMAPLARAERAAPLAHANRLVLILSRAMYRWVQLGREDALSLPPPRENKHGRTPVQDIGAAGHSTAARSAFACLL